MPALRCPHCDKTLNIPDKFAGRNVKCPGCGGALAVPAVDSEPEPSAPEPPKAGIMAAAPGRRPRSRPGRTRPRRGRREPEEKGGAKSYLKIGLLGCLGFVALVVCAGLFFWWQEESLRGYARERILAQNMDSEKRAIMLLLAESEHGAALTRAAPKNARGRRMDAAVAKEKYFEVLQKLISERYAKLKSGRKPEARTLADYWTRVDYEKGARYVVRLRSAGTYQQLVFDYLDSDYVSPVERFSGKWELKDGALVWHSGGEPDVNPVVGYSGLDFVIKEMDGSYTYWQRIAAMPKLEKHFGQSNK